MSVIQIYIVVAEKKFNPIVKKDMKIQELIKMVFEKYLKVDQPEEIELTFQSTFLNNNTVNSKGEPATLEDLKIEHGSILQVVAVLKGGMLTEDEIRKKEKNLEPLPGYIKVTTSKDHYDVYTLEDDEHTKRAIMPCDHAISPMSMREYCETSVKYGKTEISCPECSENWKWEWVKHVACFNAHEMGEIDEKIAETMLMKSSNYRSCPGCKSWVKKSNDSFEVFKCWICTSKNGKPYRFCWNCLSITSESTNYCPKNCKSSQGHALILNGCPTKMINNERSPTIRSCPKCKTLIHHESACKHMTCKICHCEFCFVCLKVEVAEYFKTHYNTKCELAARQKE